MGVKERLEATQGDITVLRVDAIVNAANAALIPGGGVDGAIRRAAGNALNERLYEIGHCDPGTAVITPGFKLPARHVIHTVAPIWNGAPEQELVFRRCYDSVLKLAEQHQIETIAFPCIGTGVYGWPQDLAANIAFDAVTKHLRKEAKPAGVIFCCFAKGDRERYERLIANLAD